MEHANQSERAGQIYETMVFALDGYVSQFPEDMLREWLDELDTFSESNVSWAVYEVRDELRQAIRRELVDNE